MATSSVLWPSGSYFSNPKVAWFMVRDIPRPFKMPWGAGQIVEEASIKAPHWEPTIQLMEYENGEHSLRFCYYSEGRFGRGPMMLREEDLEGFAAALSDTPKIRNMLSQMVGID